MRHLVPRVQKAELDTKPLTVVFSVLHKFTFHNKCNDLVFLIINILEFFSHLFSSPPGQVSAHRIRILSV